MSALARICVLSFVLLLSVASPGSSRAAQAGAQPMAVGVGDAALQFSLPAINEDAAISVVGRARISLSDLDTRDNRGVVLYFFNREEGGEDLSALSRIQKRYGGKGVVVLGICSDNAEIGPLATWIEQQKLSFPVLHDSHAVVASRYGVPKLPLTVVVDRSGAIFAIGRPESAQLESEIDAEVSALLGR